MTKIKYKIIWRNIFLIFLLVQVIFSIYNVVIVLSVVFFYNFYVLIFIMNTQVFLVYVVFSCVLKLS